MTALRSALFALLFYVGTVLFVLAGLAAMLPGGAPVRRVPRAWTCYFHWLATRIVGIRVELSGQIPPGQALIAAKHQSMFETLELVRLLPEPAFVLKRELTRIPLFGRVLQRYGVIAVDRAAGAKALRAMLAEGRRVLDDGRPLIIFPEGTRVEPGQSPPLQPGFAGLYRALGLPVVPVALDSGRLWRRGFLRRPGTIRFRFGEPITPGLSRDEIERRVHAAINALEPSFAASPPASRPPPRSSR